MWDDDNVIENTVRILPANDAINIASRQFNIRSHSNYTISSTRIYLYRVYAHLGIDIFTSHAYVANGSYYLYIYTR